jgi:TonB family protein
MNKPTFVAAALMSAALTAQILANEPREASSSSGPVCEDNIKQAYYPASAVIQNRQGRVLLEYSVNGEGRVSAVKIISEEPRGAFAKAARTFMANLTCRVPADWAQDAGPGKRYRLNMIFEFAPGGKLQPLSARDPVFNVTATRPRGA